MKKLIMSTLAGVPGRLRPQFSMAQSANPASGEQAQRSQHGKQNFRLPSERVEARLAHLKTALKITDAQQTQWDAFANVKRKQAQGADARIKARHDKKATRTEHQHATAIEQLEYRQQRMVMASERMGELLAVQKPLYAALSPEQQQLADKVLAGRRDGGKRGGHRGHGRA